MVTHEIQNSLGRGIAHAYSAGETESRDCRGAVSPGTRVSSAPSSLHRKRIVSAEMRVALEAGETEEGPMCVIGIRNATLSVRRLANPVV